LGGKGTRCEYMIEVIIYLLIGATGPEMRRFAEQFSCPCGQYHISYGDKHVSTDRRGGTSANTDGNRANGLLVF